MNTPLRRVALSIMAMMVLLLGNISYISVFKADDYRDNPINKRGVLEEHGRERGKIISRDQRVILASSNPVDSELKFQRVYSDGRLYAPITGFHSMIFGSSGLEKASNDVLNGSDIRLFVPRLSDLITGRDRRGGHIQTTIDPRLQKVAYDQLTSRGFTGSVVALQPETGEILAMVSTPSYDPNSLAALDTQDQREAWNRMIKDPAKPMANRAISEIYPPGSTFKLVVAAAALENGMTKDTPLTAAAQITLPGTREPLKNFNSNPCGGGSTASMAEALARSCNTAFGELADKLGEERLRETSEKFGIGPERLEIPMRVTPSTLGDIPGRPALFQTGIGQRDVALTPMQDAMVVATIANDGVRMRPHLIKSILTPTLSEADSEDTSRLSTAMSSSNARVLTEMMLGSEERTQGGGKIPGVTIASKTGTAEHGVNPEQTPPHAWYVAFAPADDPKIAIAVLVEDGGDRSLEATGGSKAAPIGRAVIGAALQGGG